MINKRYKRTPRTPSSCPTEKIIRQDERSSGHKQQKNWIKRIFCEMNFCNQEFPMTNDFVKKMSVASLLIAFIWIGTNCTTFRRVEVAPESKSEHVAIMAYNVENLFDTEHDEGTEDYTYLPRSVKAKRPDFMKKCEENDSKRRREECEEFDWNDTYMDRKMRRLTDTLIQVKNGKGPDILILEEVENKRVLEIWKERYLKKLGYESIVHIEGFDTRGIDSAMISKFPVAGEPKLHKIPYKGNNAEDQKWMDRSRGILEATFKLPNGDLLTAWGVHFPSQHNPTYWRSQALDYLTELQKSVPKENLLVVGGDFNIASDEDEKEGLYRRLNTNWLVSHHIGCKTCVGTHYYHTKRSWSFLDALLFRPDLSEHSGTAKWKVINNSIRIPNDGIYQKNAYGSPAAFKPKSPLGVSDHWPMVAVLALREPDKKEK